VIEEIFSVYGDGNVGKSLIHACLTMVNMKIHQITAQEPSYTNHFSSQCINHKIRFVCSTCVRMVRNSSFESNVLNR
jgi:hypothetical protein